MPTLRPEQLPAQLQQGLAPLYILQSDEALLVQEAADHIRNAARTQGYTERQVWQVEGHFNWQEALASQDTLSLFAELRLVEIRIPNGKPGAEGAKALEQYAAHLPQDTCTLVILPRLDKAGQNSKWLSALARIAQHIEIPTMTREALPSWLQTRVKQQAQPIDSTTANWLADRVEGNLLAAQQEVLKLGLIFPHGPLTLDQLQESVADVSRYDVFKLREAFLAGDLPRYQHILTGLKAEGEASTLIVWGLTEEVRALWAVGQAKQRKENLQNTLRNLRIWGARGQAIERLLPRLSASRLRQALARLAKIDRIIKGLEKDDEWRALEELALHLFSPAQPLPTGR